MKVNVVKNKTGGASKADLNIQKFKSANPSKSKRRRPISKKSAAKVAIKVEGAT